MGNHRARVPLFLWFPVSVRRCRNFFPNGHLPKPGVFNYKSLLSAPISSCLASAQLTSDNNLLLHELIDLRSPPTKGYNLATVYSTCSPMSMCLRAQS